MTYPPPVLAKDTFWACSDGLNRSSTEQDGFCVSGACNFQSSCSRDAAASARQWQCGNYTTAIESTTGKFCRVDSDSDLNAPSSLTLIYGISIGAVLALCVGLLLYLVRKNPKRAKKIFLSFLRHEVKVRKFLSFLPHVRVQLVFFRSSKHLCF